VRIRRIPAHDLEEALLQRLRDGAAPTAADRDPVD
jgi:hypothetical protein